MLKQHLVFAAVGASLLGWIGTDAAWAQTSTPSVEPPLRTEGPLTADEQTKLRAAVQAQGCSADKMDWDEEDQEFEVEAACSGRRYELKFDTAFRLVDRDVLDQVAAAQEPVATPPAPRDSRSVESVPAKADRPVTNDERAKLQRALQAEGCTGGKMEWDGKDQAFEVKGRCDGRKYDFMFDSAFRLISKDLDD